MLFVGVGALCSAFTVSGGVGCSVVRVVVSGLRCGAFIGVFRGFCSWVYVYMGLPFPGLVAAFWGLVGTPPGGIDKGRNRAREYAENSQKIKIPYKR